jgi:phospholipid/cholesterol/gamma-HCH transport system substrate-binding protein
MSRVARPVWAAALVIAVIAVVVLIARGGSTAPYTIHAQFTDAGQIVAGDLVDVGGIQAGKVTDVSLTPDGLADLTLQITESGAAPLRTGTIATVALPGLAAEAGRYIALTPAPAGNPVIPSGGVLTTSSTRGAVDLDQLLDALDPATRASLKQLIANGAAIVAPPYGKQLGKALEFLNPALSQTAALGGELLTDKASLRRLLRTTATVSKALAARQADIRGAVSGTAATLTQIAGQSAALGDSLTRAPAVLNQTRAVLADVDFALRALDPALNSLRPVAAPAAALLRNLYPAAAGALPAVDAVAALLPSARSALTGAAPVASKAVPTLHSIATGISPLLPVITGLRPYMPDVLTGFFEGVAGSAGGAYDANGHYARAIPVLSEGPALSTLVPSLPFTLAPRTGLLSRCPGGATPPAPDGSNPWIPPGQFGLCNPLDDTR